jgi:outer membrane protein assembly factor BamE
MISSRFSSLPARGLLLAPVVAALLLAGCGTRTQSTDSFLGFITPYRIDIVQGNAVTREQVAQIRPGMTREQVQSVLGSPMLVDPFHAERWDYFFALRRPGTAVQQRVVVAHFNAAGTLERLEAPDDLPDSTEFVASIVPVRKTAPPVLELTEAQRQALPAPQARRSETSATAPQGAARAYPPLEPR